MAQPRARAALQMIGPARSKTARPLRTCNMPRCSGWTGCAMADDRFGSRISVYNCRQRILSMLYSSINHGIRINMEHAQLIQAAASIAGGMAAAHYDKFSGLVATRITDIAETAVKIARAIEVEARKQP